MVISLTSQIPFSQFSILKPRIANCFLHKMQDHFLIRAADGSDDTVCGDVDFKHPLKPLLKQLPQRYSLFLSGAVDFFSDVKIILKDDKGGEELDCGTLGNPMVSALLQASSESSFGKGGDTVYDENVRKGREIKADRMGFKFTVNESSIRETVIQQFGVTKNNFLDYVRDMISKNNKDQFLSSDIDVQFYKLAIYEPGGHFQTHRDTVHSADHKATLLLEVKSDHKGGMLTLQKNGTKVFWNLGNYEAPKAGVGDTDDSEDEFTLAFYKERQEKNTLSETVKSEDFQKSNETGSNVKEVVDNEVDSKENDKEKENQEVLSKRSHQEAKEARLKWLLFYTDIEHSVSPVTEGIRIVLQFDVYDRSPSKANEKTEDEDTEENEDEEEVHKDEDEEQEMEENQEEDEEEEEEEEEEDEDDEDDFWGGDFGCSSHIDSKKLIGPKVNVLPRIISILKKQLTFQLALVIPFYHLYTYQTILPEKLKNIDKVLFDTLLNAGFRLALVSVEVVLESDYDGSYSKGNKTMKIHDFPYKVYEFGSPDSSEIKFKIMKKLPRNLDLTYVVSGLESAHRLESTDYSEYTGNEAAPGKYRYLCAAMIVFKQK
jgi:hypothetical protein